MKNRKTFKELGSFRQFCDIHEAALYQECLKYNVDPDSIMFAYEAKMGIGKPYIK